MFNKILITIFGLLMIGGIVYSAPTSNIFRTILPEADSTYDIGSSLKRWANGYFDNVDTDTITVSGLIAGDIDMGGYDITNGGTSTFANASTTNTTVSDTLYIGEICNEAGICWDSPAEAGTFVNFYPNNNVSDIATYEDMYTVPVVGVAIDESCSADADVAGGYCTIDTYVSSSTEQAIISYPAGTTEIQAYTYVDSAVGVSKLVFDGYRRTALGVETHLGQATTTEINALSNSNFISSFTGGTDTAFNPDGTDRLVMKVRGHTTSTSPKTIHWTYQTTGAYSHIKTPITRQDLGYTKSFQDETITGNWDFTGSTYLATSGGNVGIATTTPTAKFHILETGSTDAFRVDDVLADTSPFVIKADGNVGIATTTPAMKLDLYGGMMRAFNVASSTCSATTRGGIFYNEANDSFWGCKSTGFVKLDN